MLGTAPKWWCGKIRYGNNWSGKLVRWFSSLRSLDTDVLSFRHFRRFSWSRNCSAPGCWMLSGYKDSESAKFQGRNWMLYRRSHDSISLDWRTRKQDSLRMRCLNRIQGKSRLLDSKLEFGKGRLWTWVPGKNDWDMDSLNMCLLVFMREFYHWMHTKWKLTIVITQFTKHCGLGSYLAVFES